MSDLLFFFLTAISSGIIAFVGVVFFFMLWSMALSAYLLVRSWFCSRNS